MVTLEMVSVTGNRMGMITQLGLSQGANRIHLIQGFVPAKKKYVFFFILPLKQKKVMETEKKCNFW